MKPTDEIINTLRDRLCAVEEASSIKGTMLHESEEKIKMLESETATLKRQIADLVNPDGSEFKRFLDLCHASREANNLLGSGE